MTPRACTLVLLLAGCAGAPDATPRAEAAADPPVEAAATLPAPAPAPTSPPPLATPPDGTAADTFPAPPQDTVWTTDSRAGGEAVPGAPVQRSGRAAAHPGFDRAVFEFDGALPPYSVRYVDPPLEQCGSGEPVPLAGEAVLVVTFSTAQAHDDEGRATVADRAQRPGLPALRELRLVCDFEGEVTWGMGLASRAPFRVLTLREPPRLVVDVRSGSGR